MKYQASGKRSDKNSAGSRGNQRGGKVIGKLYKLR